MQLHEPKGYTMRIVFALSIVFLFAQCQPGPGDSNGKVFSYEDYCISIDKALNGAFEARGMTGTMTWTGGREGSVEIAGEDYNDMTCTYTVSNCQNGDMRMICDGGVFNTQIQLFSLDSIAVNKKVYTRVKK